MRNSRLLQTNCMMKHHDEASLLAVLNRVHGISDDSQTNGILIFRLPLVWLSLWFAAFNNTFISRNSAIACRMSQDVTVCYWKWPIEIVGLPIKNGDFHWFSMAMLNNQRVILMVHTNWLLLGGHACFKTEASTHDCSSKKVSYTLRRCLVRAFKRVKFPLQALLNRKTTKYGQ